MAGGASVRGRGVGCPSPLHGPCCSPSCPCLLTAPPAPACLSTLRAALSAAVRMPFGKCKLDHFTALIKNKTSRGW